LISFKKIGEITSKQILLTYYSNAITYGLTYNALAEINIDDAYLAALLCDTKRQNILNSNLSPLEKQDEFSKLGPLFGIPISLKEPFIVKNLPSTQGCIVYLPHKNAKDGLITKILKQKGAIPFITSNVPQALLINETMSRCYGRALNPWNLERTPGGSTGGEAILIATRSSPLGFGSDCGGSIRIPSAYTGVYGFKPTFGRVGSEGHFNATNKDRRDFENFKIVCGPMGKSVDDLALAMKCLVCEELWSNDCEIVPIKWKDEIYLSGFTAAGENENNFLIKPKITKKIGFTKNNKFFPTDKANQRAVQEAVDALKSLGYEVEEFEFPFFEEIIMTFMGISTAEGGLRSSIEKMKEEPPIDDYKKLVLTANIPNFLLPMIKFMMKMMGETRTEKLLDVVNEKTSWEYFGFCEKQHDLKRRFHIWWRNHQLDGFISPGSCLPALKHTTSNELFLCCCYNFVWTLLDYPTGVVPITKINEEEEEYEDCYHRDKIYQLAKECCKESKGLPVGVQVSTLPYQEELCLFFMKEIEKKVNFKEFPKLI